MPTALHLCVPPAVGVNGAAEMPFVSREFGKLVAAAKGAAVRVKCSVNFLWLDGSRFATGSKTIRRSAINDIKNHYLSKGGPLPEKFRQIVVLTKIEDLNKPWVRQSSDEAFIAFAEVLEEAIKKGDAQLIQQVAQNALQTPALVVFDPSFTPKSGLLSMIQETEDVVQAGMLAKVSPLLRADELEDVRAEIKKVEPPTYAAIVKFYQDIKFAGAAEEEAEDGTSALKRRASPSKAKREVCKMGLDEIKALGQFSDTILSNKKCREQIERAENIFYKEPHAMDGWTKIQVLCQKLKTDLDREYVIERLVAEQLYGLTLGSTFSRAFLEGNLRSQKTSYVEILVWSRKLRDHFFSLPAFQSLSAEVKQEMSERLSFAGECCAAFPATVSLQLGEDADIDEGATWLPCPPSAQLLKKAVRQLHFGKYTPRIRSCMSELKQFDFSELLSAGEIKKDIDAINAEFEAEKTPEKPNQTSSEAAEVAEEEKAKKQEQEKAEEIAAGLWKLHKASEGSYDPLRVKISGLHEASGGHVCFLLMWTGRPSFLRFRASKLFFLTLNVFGYVKMLGGAL